MKRLIAIAALLAVVGSGCGQSQPQQKHHLRYAGRIGQQRWCIDNHWTYVPATNSCRMQP